jgi:hypothetical protein
VLTIPAEMSDVRGTVGGDDHVVARPVGERCEIGMDGEITGGLEAHQRSLAHGDNQQPAIGEPPEARRLLDAHDRGALTAGGHARDAVIPDIGEPEGAVTPAWAFGKDQSVEEGFDLHGRETSGPSGPRQSGVAVRFGK